MQLCVIAKEPIAGRVKTRLCPPCTPPEAAAIAEAALADTLAVVAATPARGRVLALAGRPGRWLPPGVAVVDQVGDGLGARLANAFAACFRARPGEPVVLIGMDTPQVRPELLIDAGRRLGGGADAVLGPAADGGYWLIGLARPVPGAFAGVPMSSARTGSAQLDRLRALGCRTECVDRLTDVDDAGTARQVAAAVPGSRFAGAVGAILGGEPARSAQA